MHRFRHGFRAERAVDFLRDERNERRSALREGQKRIIQCRISLIFVVVVLAFPETAAAPADIPVREVFDEFFKTVRRFLEMERVHCVPDFFDHVRKRGENPAGQRIFQCFGSLAVCGGLPFVDVRISREETERVPDRQDHGAHDLLDAVFGELEVLRAHHRRTEQEQTQGVCAVSFDDIHRIGIVFQALGHFLSVFR